MNDGPPEGTRVGVVGAGADGAAVDAVSAGGGDPVAGDAETVLGSDPVAVVAVGEGALVDLAAAGVEVPVVPVSPPQPMQPVPVSGLGAAIASVLAGAFEGVAHPVLSLGTDAPGGERARALFDLALVTAEPARISEYTVLRGDERVSTVRADGILVATPAGSTGYARAADGPVLAPGTGVVAVVPISPFATDADHWVLPDDGVGLRVERDEAAVDLVADGREVGSVEAGRTLRVSTRGSLTVAVVEASAGAFG
jgi:NAD+ kinase